MRSSKAKKSKKSMASTTQKTSKMSTTRASSLNIQANTVRVRSPREDWQLENEIAIEHAHFHTEASTELYLYLVSYLTCIFLTYPNSFLDVPDDEDESSLSKAMFYAMSAVFVVMLNVSANKLFRKLSTGDDAKKRERYNKIVDKEDDESKLVSQTADLKEVNQQKKESIIFTSSWISFFQVFSIAHAAIDTIITHTLPLPLITPVSLFAMRILFPYTDSIHYPWQDITRKTNQQAAFIRALTPVQISIDFASEENVYHQFSNFNVILSCDLANEKIKTYLEIDQLITDYLSHLLTNKYKIKVERLKENEIQMKVLAFIPMMLKKVIADHKKFGNYLNTILETAIKFNLFKEELDNLNDIMSTNKAEINLINNEESQILLFNFTVSDKYKVLFQRCGLDSYLSDHEEANYKKTKCIFSFNKKEDSHRKLTELTEKIKTLITMINNLTPALLTQNEVSGSQHQPDNKSDPEPLVKSTIKSKVEDKIKDEHNNSVNAHDAKFSFVKNKIEFRQKQRQEDLISKKEIHKNPKTLLTNLTIVEDQDQSRGQIAPWLNLDSSELPTLSWTMARFDPLEPILHSAELELSAEFYHALQLLITSPSFDLTDKAIKRSIYLNMCFLFNAQIGVPYDQIISLKDKPTQNQILKSKIQTKCARHISTDLIINFIFNEERESAWYSLETNSMLIFCLQNFDAIDAHLKQESMPVLPPNFEHNAIYQKYFPNGELKHLAPAIQPAGKLVKKIVELIDEGYQDQTKSASDFDNALVRQSNLQMILVEIGALAREMRSIYYRKCLWLFGSMLPFKDYYQQHFNMSIFENIQIPRRTTYSGKYESLKFIPYLNAIADEPAKLQEFMSSLADFKFYELLLLCIEIRNYSHELTRQNKNFNKILTLEFCNGIFYQFIKKLPEISEKISDLIKDENQVQDDEKRELPQPNPFGYFYHNRTDSKDELTDESESDLVNGYENDEDDWYDQHLDSYQG